MTKCEQCSKNFAFEKGACLRGFAFEKGGRVCVGSFNMFGAYYEWRGFTKLEENEWHTHGAGDEQRGCERRTDLYVVVPLEAFNIKLRHGTELEVKYLKHKAKGGLERWGKAVCYHECGSVEDIERALCEQKAGPLLDAGMALRSYRQGSAWKPPLLVACEKIRVRVEWGVEDTLVRIEAEKGKPRFYRTLCSEGLKPRSISADMMAKIEACEFIGSYSAFLTWLLLG